MPGIKEIKGLPAVDITSHESLDKNGIKEVFRGFGEVENKRSGRNVKFPATSAGKIIRHRGFDSGSIVRHFATLFETSVHILSESEIVKAGHNNHETYEHYVNKFAVGKDEYYIRFTVPIVRKSKEAHVHSSAITSVQVYKVGNSTLYPSNTSGSSSSLFMDTQLADFLASVKGEDVSKVVDVNA